MSAGKGAYSVSGKNSPMTVTQSTFVEDIPLFEHNLEDEDYDFAYGLRGDVAYLRDDSQSRLFGLLQVKSSKRSEENEKIEA